MESSLAHVSIKHCDKTHHVPNCQRGITNAKQSCNVYFSALLEGFRQRLNAQSDRHQGVSAKKMANPFRLRTGKKKKKITDVIGRKCLGSYALCFAELLHSF